MASDAPESTAQRQNEALAGHVFEHGSARNHRCQHCFLGPAQPQATGKQESADDGDLLERHLAQSSIGLRRVDSDRDLMPCREVVRRQKGVETPHAVSQIR